MKTRRSYTVVMLIMALLFAAALQAEITNKSLSDQINPPFGTYENNPETGLLAVVFEEESYIHDIPFNTTSIAAIHQFETALSVDYTMPEEAYFDDIPFSTENVVETTLYQEAMAVNYEMEEEDYINDIPFDTHSMVNKIKCNNHFAMNN